MCEEKYMLKRKEIMDSLNIDSADWLMQSISIIECAHQKAKN
jgi:hypothetical protein